MGGGGGDAARDPAVAGGGELAALLAGPVVVAARGLLGCLVTAGGVTVRLTEVEAYSGWGRIRPRTRTAAVPAGTR